MSTSSPSARVKGKKTKEVKERPVNGVSAATVHPVQQVQPQPQSSTMSTPLSHSPTAVAVAPMPQRSPRPRANGQVEREEPNPRGQVVKPESVPESSVVGSVAELVHDVIPQSASTTSQPVERIDWVDIQRCERAGNRSRLLDVVILGLARGYQIWTMMENGDCEEVLSERQGPLRVGRLLPSNPEPSFGCRADKFSSSRPLLAVVDASSPVPDRQYCLLHILSLVTSNVVAKHTFEEPIGALQTSSKCVVVAFASRLVLLDAMTLSLQRNVAVPAAVDGVVPFSLSDRLLVFPETKLSVRWQSCGGLSTDEETLCTVTSQMMSVAKSISKTVTALGETVVGSSSPASVASSGAVPLSKLATPGILVAVDVERLPENEFSTEKNGGSGCVIAHWVASAERVAHLQWSPTGRLLLVGGVSSTSFNLFSVLPHSATPSLAAVQHLYSLVRGNTPAKVVSSCWSWDERWLAVATNHGTVHAFAVCPFGGTPTRRTHAGRLPNRESRFLRSAGLADGPTAADAREKTALKAAATAYPSSAPTVSRDHPSLCRPSLAGAVSDPRLGPFPPPLQLPATKKIKQHYLSADQLQAWASDLTPTALSKSASGGVKASEGCRVAVAFSSTSSGPTLLIASVDGQLTEYRLVPKSPSEPRNQDERIRVHAQGIARWTLHRTKSSMDVRAPLPRGNNLLLWLHDSPVERVEKGADEWTFHVEPRTYGAPHRRLWQGPQFSFFAYKEDQADLVAPTAATSTKKSVPVVISPSPLAASQRVVYCGSFDSSARSFSESADISSKIADAMRESRDEVDVGGGSQESFYDPQSPSPKSSRRDADDCLLQFDDF